MSTPAGWYVDPEQPGQQRYWDGVAWTEHRAQIASLAATEQTAAAVETEISPALPRPTGGTQDTWLTGDASGTLSDAFPPKEPSPPRSLHTPPERPGRPRVFGAGKYTQALEAENEHLRAWVEHLNGAEPMAVAAQVEAARNELVRLDEQIERARTELGAVEGQLASARAALVETDDLAMLQQVGVYAFTHPLDDAPAYKARLDEARSRITAMVRDKVAVTAISGWTVNNSAAAGRKMVSETSKLMLNAYNAEVDTVIRTLKPYKLPAAIDRLNKTRNKIARLGRIMQIQISTDYHALRVYEVQLTADYMKRVAEEKDAQREERARQREEERARKEFEAEKARLRKEQAHYAGVLQQLESSGDEVGAADLRARLEAISADIAAVESREANIRAGHVYVISNIGSFGEGVVKIGMTRRLEPEDRVKELGDASVPFRYDVHALIFSSDAVSLEARLHQEFAEARINRINLRREFFAVSPQDVKNALSRIDDQYLLRFHEIPEAEEWRASRNLAHQSVDG